MRNIAIIAAAAALSSPWALAGDPAPETLLAKKGDIEVTAGDFYAYIARLPEGQRSDYRAELDRISRGVSSIFVTRSLSQEARAQGIDKEPEIQRRLRLAEESLLATIYLERYQKTIKAPDFEEQAREAYKSDPDRYKVPPMVKHQRILVSFQGRTEEEAKRRAEEARAKIAAGDQFFYIARDYSNDPSFRSNQGVVTSVPDKLDAGIAAVLRNGELNKPSAPIRTPEGFYVIVPLERTPASVIPYEKAKKGIINDFQGKYRTQAVDKMIGSLTNSKDVTLYTDAIASLKLDVDYDATIKALEEAGKKHAEEKQRVSGEAAKPAGQ